jgi:hypothetical protein
LLFPDRYSIAVIDADSYLIHPEKKQLAQAFYNDTLLNDQNACSSPSLVVWTGRDNIRHAHFSGSIFRYWQKNAIRWSLSWQLKNAPVSVS